MDSPRGEGLSAEIVADCYSNWKNASSTNLRFVVGVCPVSSLLRVPLVWIEWQGNLVWCGGVGTDSVGFFRETSKHSDDKNGPTAALFVSSRPSLPIVAG
jgi:hypothetical protein